MTGLCLSPLGLWMQGTSKTLCVVLYHFFPSQLATACNQAATVPTRRTRSRLWRLINHKIVPMSDPTLERYDYLISTKHHTKCVQYYSRLQVLVPVMLQCVLCMPRFTLVSCSSARCMYLYAPRAYARFLRDQAAQEDIVCLDPADQCFTTPTIKPSCFEEAVGGVGRSSSGS